MKPKPWTKPEKAKAKALLGQCITVAEAMGLIREQVRPINIRALRDILPNPSQYLKAPQVEDLAEGHDLRSKLTRSKAETKVLLDRLASLEKEADVRRQLAEGCVPPVVMRDLRKHKRQGAAVILASDWHVEEIVPPGVVPTGNVYNLPTAERRIERFFAGARWLIDFHRPVFGMHDVVLWLGGDFITGSIHDDPPRALGDADAIVWVEQRLLDGIKFLLEDKGIRRLTIVCSYGNHGRTTRKPRRATGASYSWEWLMYQHLGQNLRGLPRVEFEATPSAHQYLQVYGYQLHFHHGDEMNYRDGVGGLSIPLNKAVDKWDRWKKCDIHNFGHWHQYLDLGYAVVNGSLIGTAPYGMAIRAIPEPAQQAFYVIDSKRGKTCKSPVWVEQQQQ